MNLSKTLVIKLKEVLTEGTWVTGTNFKDQIIDIPWDKAIQKYRKLNSIADLTFHVSYYIAGVSQVLEGGTLDIKDKFSFDYPAVTNEEDWAILQEKFISDSEKFISLVEQLSDEELSEPFVDEKYGQLHRNIDVIIEHTYYHLGQLILIRKLLGIQ